MRKRTATAALVWGTMAAGGLVLAGGCGGNRSAQPDAAMMDTTGLSKEQVTERGEQMMARGQTMTSRAALMSDSASMDGMSRDEVHDRGEQMMRDGQALVARGNGM